MTTATAVAGNRTMETAVMKRPRRSLEELVDRLMDALFKEEAESRRSRARRGRSTRRDGSGRRATSTGRWRSSAAWT